MKNHNIQSESDNKEDNIQKGFGEGPKQAQYKELIYLIFKINISFQTDGTTKKES